MSRSPRSVHFNRPTLVGNELHYLRQAVASMHTSGNGPFTARCRAILKRELGAAEVLLTPSCTHALEMVALLLEVEHGDEVIIPSFGFVSIANAFALRGARPIFVDVRPDTLNLDERRLEERISAQTRGVVVLHYGGVGCEMEAIGKICRRRGVVLIEDNAHGLFGRWRGFPLGSFGALTTVSFHETKNVTCGEGGALVINDASFAERAEIMRDKGTDRQHFFRGEVDKYTWVDLGSSFALSDLLAAFLYAQLETRRAIASRRRVFWQRYDRAFRGRLERYGVALPVVPSDCETTHHIYHLVLPSLEIRQRLILHLASHGIEAVFHYTPLHLSRMGRRYGGQPGDCPVTEAVSDRLLRLPLHNAIEPADQTVVIRAVLQFFEGTLGRRARRASQDVSKATTSRLR